MVELYVGCRFLDPMSTKKSGRFTGQFQHERLESWNPAQNQRILSPGRDLTGIAVFARNPQILCYLLRFPGRFWNPYQGFLRDFLFQNGTVLQAKPFAQSKDA